MNTPDQLITSLQARGVKLWIENGQVRLRSPKGTILPAEMAALQVWKADVMERLAEAQAVATIPMVPRTRSGPLPLTGTQLMPWYFTDKRQPRVRTLPFAFRVRGPLDVTAMEKSLRALQHRHEALRTRVFAVDGHPQQRIEAVTDLQLIPIDLADEPRANVELLADTHAQEFVNHAVDYSVQPLFDARLIKMANDDHILVVSIDHLISDGHSNETLKRELWILYRQFQSGSEIPLPKLPLQFADYAVWQEGIHALWSRTHGRYWTERLSDIPPLPLPFDTAAADGSAKRFVDCEVGIEPQTSAALLDLAQRNRVLPALVVLTAYVAAVSRWCNVQDLAVAVVDSGRYRSELIPMVGCLASHLHLRVQHTEHDTLTDLLNSIKRELDSSYDHRDFDWVTRLVPGFAADLYFNWTPSAASGTPDASETVPAGLDIQPFPLSLDEQTVVEVVARIPFKLMLFCSLAGAEISARVSYDASCFTRETIEEFAGNLRRCLQELSERPQSRLATASFG